MDSVGGILTAPHKGKINDPIVVDVSLFGEYNIFNRHDILENHIFLL